MTTRRRRQVVEEEPLLFDLPLAAPPPADRRARRSSSPSPVQVDLFSAESEVEEEVDVEPIGELTLKGFRTPVPALNVIAVREPADLPAMHGS